jgi:D-psicose/D-tagatose/L-ribulose 3-epimerase
VTTPEEVSIIVTETKRAGFDLLEMSLHDSAQLDVPTARAALYSALGKYGQPLSVAWP